MSYLYIENYLDLSKKQKMKFLNFINRCKDFKISNQKIVFSDESLIISFLEDSDIQKAYSSIKNFFVFQKLRSIEVNIVKKTFDKSNQMILTFLNTNKQIRV